jgi:hypothetical protein
LAAEGGREKNSESVTMMMAGYIIVLIIVFIINIAIDVIALLLFGVVVFWLSKIIFQFSIPVRIRWLYIALIVFFPVYAALVALLFPSLGINLPWFPMAINIG